MKKMLIKKTINSCFNCPMCRETENEKVVECSYLGMRISKEYLTDGVIPIDCPLPDAPVTKLLKITKCSECRHCGKSDLSTVITTYPPIYEENYMCLLTRRSFKGNSVNHIQDDCPLEDSYE